MDMLNDLPFLAAQNEQLSGCSLLQLNMNNIPVCRNNCFM